MSPNESPVRCIEGEHDLAAQHIWSVVPHPQYRCGFSRVFFQFVTSMEEAIATDA